MRSRKLAFGLIAALVSGGALAESAGQLPPVSDQEPIYGAQMMTEQERLQHRQRLRDASSLEERERIRAEHHERMSVRAQERGVSIPGSPPAKGGGMGPGGGGGKGSGGGR
jgi:hypothetical protein